MTNPRIAYIEFNGPDTGDDEEFLAVTETGQWWTIVNDGYKAHSDEVEIVREFTILDLPPDEVEVALSKLANGDDTMLGKLLDAMSIKTYEPMDEPDKIGAVVDSICACDVENIHKHIKVFSDEWYCQSEETVVHWEEMSKQTLNEDE